MIRCPDVLIRVIPDYIPAGTTFQREVKIDEAPVEALTTYLTKQIWGYMRLECDFDRAGGPLWLCRASRYPFIRGSGAGTTMEEALRRCAHCMAYRHKHCDHRVPLHEVFGKEEVDGHET